MSALELVFWLAAGLIAYTHLGYPLLLWLLARLRRRRRQEPRPRAADLPMVSLIIPAYDEETVIGRKVADALALDYPRELLEVIVASDGSSDRTAESAREAGADLVLELPPGGKLATQNAAARRAGGEVLAFSDANAFWEPGALRRLVRALADPRVGYVCGQVRFTNDVGDNLEGAYWRY
jgi:cellulose synthase/poly-beta-1,6-N-acetylglucosamine synthase-like glycosyltransferase